MSMTPHGRGIVTIVAATVLLGGGCMNSLAGPIGATMLGLGATVAVVAENNDAGHGPDIVMAVVGSCLLIADARMSPGFVEIERDSEGRDFFICMFPQMERPGVNAGLSLRF